MEYHHSFLIYEVLLTFLCLPIRRNRIVPVQKKEGKVWLNTLYGADLANK